MRIKSVRIENYKSYDTSEMKFSTMFNVIVGQNNSGKTALLEALDLANFRRSPHKRMENGKPASQNPLSRVEVEIAASGDELKNLYLSKGGRFNIPVSSNDTEEVAREVDQFFSRTEITVPFSLEPEGSGLKFVGAFTRERFAAAIQVNSNRQTWAIDGVVGQSLFTYEPVQEQFFRSIYFSRAERLVLTRSGLDSEKILRPRAENLPTVLLHLQLERPARYKLL